MVHVPVVRRKPWGILCLVMNLLPLSGIGTMMAAANQENTKYFVYGVLQFLLGIMIVGWVWGVVMGVMIFLKSE